MRGGTRGPRRPRRQAANKPRARRREHESRSQRSLAGGCRYLFLRRRIRSLHGPLFGRSGQQDRVFVTHLRISLLPGLFLLLGEPSGFHIRFHLLESRDSSGNDGVDKNQVPTIARFDRPLPRSGFELLEGHDELGTEFLGQRVGSAVAVIVLEHELVGERGGELGVFGLAGDLSQGLSSVVLSVLSTVVRRKIKMAA